MRGKGGRRALSISGMLGSYKGLKEPTHGRKRFTYLPMVAPWYSPQQSAFINDWMDVYLRKRAEGRLVAFWPLVKEAWECEFTVPDAPQDVKLRDQQVSRCSEIMRAGTHHLKRLRHSFLARYAKLRARGIVV